MKNCMEKFVCSADTKRNFKITMSVCVIFFLKIMEISLDSLCIQRFLIKTRHTHRKANFPAGWVAYNYYPGSN